MMSAAPPSHQELPPGTLRRAIVLRWREFLLRRSYKSRLVCKGGITRICIEGSPRSANSYAVRVFRSANQVPIAHHTHSTENIVLVLGYGVPVLALIRDPLDAITFSSLYRKLSLDEEFARWIDFYTYIESMLDDTVVADSREVVQDYSSVIGVLNARYGTEFSDIGGIAAQRRLCSETSMTSANCAARGWIRYRYRRQSATEQQRSAG